MFQTSDLYYGISKATPLGHPKGWKIRIPYTYVKYYPREILPLWTLSLQNSWYGNASRQQASTSGSSTQYNSLYNKNDITTVHNTAIQQELNLLWFNLSHNRELTIPWTKKYFYSLFIRHNILYALVVKFTYWTPDWYSLKKICHIIACNIGYYYEEKRQLQQDEHHARACVLLSATLQKIVSLCLIQENLALTIKILVNTHNYLCYLWC